MRSSRLRRCFLSWITWVVAYVLATLAFALLFTEKRQDFFHATAQFEPELRLEARALRGVIERLISAQFRDSHFDDTLSAGLWTLRVDRIRVTDVFVDPDDANLYPSNSLEQGRLHFIVSAMPMLKDNSAAASISVEFVLPRDFTSELMLSLPESLQAVSPFTPQVLRSRSWTTMPRVGAVPSAIMTAQISEQLGAGLIPDGSQSSPFAGVVTPELGLRLNQFIDACSGFPGLQDRWAAFPRMLYLSVVTITTLGYGDILALTRAARTLIAIEAVLGVVIAGLAVNALFARARS